MTKQMLVMAVVCTLSGCMIGPSTRNYAPARTPGGVLVSLTLRELQIRGELLAVQDTALVVLSDLQLPKQEIVLVPYRLIERGRFDQTGEATIRNGKIPFPEKQAHLRRLSRFPQGLDQELLSRLLAAYDQTEWRVVR